MCTEQPSGDAVEGGEADRRDDLFVSRESRTRSYGMTTALPSQGRAALDRGWRFDLRPTAGQLMYGDFAKISLGGRPQGSAFRRYLTIINPRQRSMSLFQDPAVFGADDNERADVERGTV
jgi:hypothetical protein